MDFFVATVQDITARLQAEGFAQEILDNVLGLGPIEPLVRDPAVSDILINGPKNIFVDRKGKLIAAQAKKLDAALDYASPLRGANLELSRTLGELRDVPRRRGSVGLRLDTGAEVRAWTRDPAALHAALEAAVGHHPDPA